MATNATVKMSGMSTTGEIITFSINAPTPLTSYTLRRAISDKFDGLPCNLIFVYGLVNGDKIELQDGQIQAVMAADRTFNALILKSSF